MCSRARRIVSSGVPAAVGAIGRDRRGGVAVLGALVGPVLVMLAGVGVEVASWAAIQGRLQRTADLAARAGGLVHFAGATARGAADAAADAAELNGMAGGATRTWDAVAQTLTDGPITVRFGAAVRDGRDTGLTVTLARTVQLGLTRLMNPTPAITLRASATVDVGRQPCLLALKPDGVGIGTTGNTSITLRSCSVVSNASISTNGSATLSAPAFYARGSIGGVTGGPLYPGGATVADPYATHAPVQDAFARLVPGQGGPLPDSGVMSPGTYAGGTIHGAVTLRAGTYYINGGLYLGSQASLTGAGVTIVSSGVFGTSGQASVNLSAPPQGDTRGGIPGVAYASTATGTSGLGAGASATVSGLVYQPNGTLSFSGHAGAGQDCLQIVAAGIQMAGGSNLVAGGCGLYGARLFGSTGASPVALTR